MNSTQFIKSKRPLYWLALGTFAVGTESFMIAGLLPAMAKDLGVNVATAGQLVTVFALAYALSSPVLAALTGNLNRRRLLIGAMAAFALANLLAFTASGYWSLMAARVVLALATAVYVLGANALAISGRAVDRRGPRAVILPALATSTAAFVVLSLAPHFIGKQFVIVPIVLAIAAWGVAHWAFYPAQQTTLVGVAGVASAPVVLSLNASFMYLGFSLGAGLGSLTLHYSSLANLGFVSALCAATALALAYTSGRRPAPQLQPSH